MAALHWADERTNCLSLTPDESADTAGCTGKVQWRQARRTGRGLKLDPGALQKDRNRSCLDREVHVLRDIANRDNRRERIEVRRHHTHHNFV